jgi:hypothetical protein
MTQEPPSVRPRPRTGIGVEDTDGSEIRHRKGLLEAWFLVGRHEVDRIPGDAVAVEAISTR